MSITRDTEEPKARYTITHAPTHVPLRDALMHAVDNSQVRWTSKVKALGEYYTLQEAKEGLESLTLSEGEHDLLRAVCDELQAKESAPMKPIPRGRREAGRANVSYVETTSLTEEDAEFLALQAKIAFVGRGGGIMSAEEAASAVIELIMSTEPKKLIGDIKARKACANSLRTYFYRSVFFPAAEEALMATRLANGGESVSPKKMRDVVDAWLRGEPQPGERRLVQYIEASWAAVPARGASFLTQMARGVDAEVVAVQAGIGVNAVRNQAHRAVKKLCIFYELQAVQEGVHYTAYGADRDGW